MAYRSRIPELAEVLNERGVRAGEDNTHRPQHRNSLMPAMRISRTVHNDW